MEAEVEVGEEERVGGKWGLWGGRAFWWTRGCRNIRSGGVWQPRFFDFQMIAR